MKKGEILLLEAEIAKQITSIKKGMLLAKDKKPKNG